MNSLTCIVTIGQPPNSFVRFFCFLGLFPKKSIWMYAYTEFLLVNFCHEEIISAVELFALFSSGEGSRSWTFDWNMPLSSWKWAEFWDSANPYIWVAEPRAVWWPERGMWRRDRKQPVRSFVHSFIRSFVHSFIRSFVHSFIRSFVHSFIRSFVHSFIRSLVHSFISLGHPILSSVFQVFPALTETHRG